MSNNPVIKKKIKVSRFSGRISAPGRLILIGQQLVLSDNQILYNLQWITMLRQATAGIAP